MNLLWCILTDSYEKCLNFIWLLYALQMDCNIQVRNFQFSSVTCRLCLSENLSAPYTDLSEDIVKAEDIRHVLTLQYSTPRAQVTYLHVVVPVMAMTYTKCPEKNTLWQENSFLKSNFLWTLGIVFINVWIMYHGYRMSQIKVLNVYLSSLVLNIWEFCNWSGCFYMNEPWITINFQLFRF